MRDTGVLHFIAFVFSPCPPLHPSRRSRLLLCPLAYDHLVFVHLSAETDSKSRFPLTSRFPSGTPRAAGGAPGAISGAAAGGATFAEVDRLQSVARQRQGQADVLQQR